MILTEIQAIRFRNLTGTLHCGPRLNFLYGENAQGKTNWLEAIYLLSTTKSFRTSILKETLPLEPVEDIDGVDTTTIVRGKVKQNSLNKDLQVQLNKNLKAFYINGKRETISHYLGQMDVVIFCTEEMAIVRGEPSERRRFLDRGIVGLTPSYLKTLAEYNRILKQKNSLLKEAQTKPASQYYDLLEVWNAQLVTQAGIIHQARQHYIVQLQQFLDQQFFSDKPLAVVYQSGLMAHGLTSQASLSDYCQLLQQRLNLRREQEIAAGYALIGPHRDEVMILQQGQEISRFGSAGEQRSALITLDLAQMEVYNCAFEEYPIFLIDDIDAELDHRRISLLLDHVAEKMQVFVSTSKKEIVLPYRRYSSCNHIYQGTIMPVEPIAVASELMVGDIATVDARVTGADIEINNAVLKNSAVTSEKSVSEALAPKDVVSNEIGIANVPSLALPANRVSATPTVASVSSVDKHQAPF